MKSYRGITVTHHIEAVLHRIVINRLAVFAETTGLLEYEQYGFQRGRNTEQAVAVLMMLLEARAIYGGADYVLCVSGCEVGFDSVSREALTIRLFDAGIRGRVLAYLRASPMMDNVRTLMGDPLGVQWSDTRGVSQGTVGGAVCVRGVGQLAMQAWLARHWVAICSRARPPCR